MENIFEALASDRQADHPVASLHLQIGLPWGEAAPLGCEIHIVLKGDWGQSRMYHDFGIGKHCTANNVLH